MITHLHTVVKLLIIKRYDRIIIQMDLRTSIPFEKFFMTVICQKFSITCLEVYDT